MLAELKRSNIMNTKKNLKKITIAATTLAIGAVAAVSLAVALPKKQRAASAETYEVSETVTTETSLLERIEALEKEYQEAFDAHAELWEKYFAAVSELEEGIAEDFDEKAFVLTMETLTEEEKATLVAQIEKLDALDEELEKLYGELFEEEDFEEYDYDCTYGKYKEEFEYDFEDEEIETRILTEEEFEEEFRTYEEDYLKAETRHEEIQTLLREYDEIVNSRAKLWDKVYASYDLLDETFDYANFDEVTYIIGLETLTEEEKAILLEDITKLNEIAAKLYEACGPNCRGGRR